MFVFKKFKLDLFLFLLVFIVYVHHLSLSVYGGDVGDFLTAIVTRTVPHPSGYPLFTILGIIFSYLPFGPTIAWKVGLISALCASFAVVLVYRISKLLIPRTVLCVIGALTIAFLYPFWLYAEVAEVFAMAVMFVVLLLYLGLLFADTKQNRYLYLLTFCFGLSLSNHLTTFLLGPLLLVLVLRANWRVLLMPKVLGTCTLLLIAGLLPYLYLPLTAHNVGYVGWGYELNTVSGFIAHVTRKVYGWTSSTPIDIQPKPLDTCVKFIHFVHSCHLLPPMLQIHPLSSNEE